LEDITSFHAISQRDLLKRRNILVHMYAEVDVEMVYEILQNNLGDFDEFTKYIARYLEKGEKE